MVSVSAEIFSVAVFDFVIIFAHHEAVGILYCIVDGDASFFSKVRYACAGFVAREVVRHPILVVGVECRLVLHAHLCVVRATGIDIVYVGLVVVYAAEHRVFAAPLVVGVVAAERSFELGLCEWRCGAVDFLAGGFAILVDIK